MTLYEASSRFGISERKLQAYESYGILHCQEKNGIRDYSEEELKLLSEFCFLDEAGVDLKYLKELVLLQKKADSQENQIRLLRKLRFEMLNDIHKKQQSLDSVDFLINRIRQKGGKGK